MNKFSMTNDRHRLNLKVNDPALGAGLQNQLTAAIYVYRIHTNTQYSISNQFCFAFYMDKFLTTAC